MKKRDGLAFAILVILEVAMLATLFSSLTGLSIAGVGTNVTVITLLEVGNTWPEVLNVSINDDAATITLTANASTQVNCTVVVRDYNGEGDIESVNATFYHSVDSSHESADDNNTHYTNSSCNILTSFGSYNGYNDDAYSAVANCSFQVQYYANPGIWRCNATAMDNVTWTDSRYDESNISELLAIALPAQIDYGIVNATEVSEENRTNVTNVGNVLINISLEGYARTQGDGYAMNCSWGNVQNISVEYEKYNLTASTPGVLDHAQFILNYTNLSSSAIVRYFNLSYRQNDTVSEAIKPSYWRIYVPKGVAGNCTGNIIFGATVAPGT